MSAKFLAAVLTLQMAVGVATADEVVQPERATAVIVSNRDVNRLNCPQGVQDVVWSAEKPVKVSRAGENVFVKFLVARQGERETFATTPLDVHVVCGGVVYTMILHPRDTDSVTVRLADGKRPALQAVAKEWASLAIEDRVKRMTLAVYRNQIPDTFTRKLPAWASKPSSMSSLPARPCSFPNGTSSCRRWVRSSASPSSPSCSARTMSRGSS
jgi:hypothetical protein